MTAHPHRPKSSRDPPYRGRLPRHAGLGAANFGRIPSAEVADIQLRFPFNKHSGDSPSGLLLVHCGSRWDRLTLTRFWNTASSPKYDRARAPDSYAQILLAGVSLVADAVKRFVGRDVGTLLIHVCDEPCHAIAS